jgi:hypothetical protein
VRIRPASSPFKSIERENSTSNDLLAFQRRRRRSVGESTCIQRTKKRLPPSSERPPMCWRAAGEQVSNASRSPSRSPSKRPLLLAAQRLFGDRIHSFAASSRLKTCERNKSGGKHANGHSRSRNRSTAMDECADSHRLPAVRRGTRPFPADFQFIPAALRVHSTSSIGRYSRRGHSLRSAGRSVELSGVEAISGRTQGDRRADSKSGRGSRLFHSSVRAPRPIGLPSRSVAFSSCGSCFLCGFSRTWPPFCALEWISVCGCEMPFVCSCCLFPACVLLRRLGRRIPRIGTKLNENQVPSGRPKRTDGRSPKSRKTYQTIHKRSFHLPFARPSIGIVCCTERRRGSEASVQGGRPPKRRPKVVEKVESPHMEGNLTKLKPPTTMNVGWDVNFAIKSCFGPGSSFRTRNPDVSWEQPGKWSRNEIICEYSEIPRSRRSKVDFFGSF